MIIKKTRIRNLRPHLSILKDGAKFYIGIQISPDLGALTSKIGFTPDLKNGETVLPASLFGPISRFNSNGKRIALKNEPMETAYRQVEWHWKDWGGYDHWKIVDVPYKRYPGKFLKPPSV